MFWGFHLRVSTGCHKGLIGIERVLSGVIIKELTLFKPACHDKRLTTMGFYGQVMQAAFRAPHGFSQDFGVANGF